MNVHKLLTERAERYAAKPALIFKDEAVTFADLQKKVAQLANAMQALGVSPGTKVAIYLPNSPQYVYSYLASFVLGAVVVPLDYQLKEDELISCLDHSETKVLIAQKRPDVVLEQVQNSVKLLIRSVIVNGATANDREVSYDALTAQASAVLPDVIVDSKSPAMILYTSGTTGKPKGILLSYRHLQESPKAMENFVDLSDRDIKLCAIPLSHVGGFIYIQNCLTFAITLVLMDRFNPIEFLRNVQSYKVTCFHIVPAMYTALLSLKNLEKFDLSSLRWAVVFGAPSSPEILERFHQYCPNAQLLNGWGMTETCPPNTVTPLGSKKIESVGKPSPSSEIKIVDDRNQTLAVNEIGEIVMRGPAVMDGYYKDPETTHSLMTNGWFHTGDLGRLDADGFLYIVGRKKEMIKVGGQIVFAPEVESALHKHPDVAEVAVIGVPDALRGETVKAFVVFKDGSGLTPEELRYFAKEHLANFKVPQTIEVRQDLPKNRTGKIDKEFLKQTAGVA